MPILDSEDYSLKGAAPAMSVLHGLLAEAGIDPSSVPISLLNIYCGIADLKRPDASPWHVCVERPYGQLYIIFQHVRHGNVVETSVSEIANCLGLCITLMWTSGKPVEEEVRDAIQTADDIVQSAELVRGQPLPIPLKPRQLSDRFAIKTINPTAPEGKTVLNTIVLPLSNAGTIVADDMLVQAVGLQVGALDLYPDFEDDPLWAALKLSATWQRRAIRALGVEEWPDAVVASNVWIETLMVRLAAILQSANGTPLQDIPTLVMRGGLAKFANAHLGSPFLKGNWDHTRADTAFGAWHAQCFLLRNEIVHAGRLVGEMEAHAAYTAAHSLAHDITRRAAKVKDPKLVQALRALRKMSATIEEKVYDA